MWLQVCRRSFSTKKPSAISSSSSHPFMNETEVQTHKHLGLRSLTLDRPKALNALTLPMIRTMTPQLQAFEESDICKIVLLKGTGRAFCAGGDVKEVITLAKKNDPNAVHFFREEYQLNHLLATMSKPVVAILNGITMGGGVGLSMHVPFRIATENTVFSMPETAIGFFPDVGSSFFLPRLDNNLGIYLGLTGARLQGQEAFWSGIATHYVPSERLPALEKRLAELDTSDCQLIHQAIEEYTGDVTPSANKFFRDEERTVIDQCFGHDTVEKIFDSLAKSKSAFAATALTTLSRMSPLGMKIALRLLRNGGDMDLVSCFKTEFRLTQNLVQAISMPDKSHDFYTGVHHLLVQKSKEKAPWNPPDLDSLSDKELDWYFQEHPSFQKEWKPFTPLTFTQYPTNVGLPSEHDVENVVKYLESDSGKVTKQRILDTFKHGYLHRPATPKLGLAEKVEYVLRTRYSVDGHTGVVRRRSIAKM